MVFVLISVICGISDIISKYMVFAAIHDDVGGRETIKVIPNILQFGKVINHGIVWGLFPGASKIWLAVSLIAIPIIVTIFVLIKRPTWYSTISFGLILAGTVGNFYDRVLFHGVRDFIDFYVIRTSPLFNLVDSYFLRHIFSVSNQSAHFPFFNLADSYITLGVFIMSFYLLFIDGRRKPAPTSIANS